MGGVGALPSPGRAPLLRLGTKRLSSRLQTWWADYWYCSFATKYGVFDKVEAACLAARDGGSIEKTIRFFDEADKVITRALIEAETTMLPSQWASLHPWRPDLVTAPRKPSLITKYCKASLNKKIPPRVFQLFAEQARIIDTSWTLPEQIPAVLEDSKNTVKQRAIHWKKNRWKLRKKFLQQKCEEQVSCIDEEGHFFGILHTRTDMTKSNPQAINYPYPTANTPPLTTHCALIVCEALRCVCLCDDDRDAKEDDCDSDVSTSDQFSSKQLRKAMISVLRRHKPLTNALDGLYLPCVDLMLEAHWVEGCAESLPRRTCVWWISRRGLPFTPDGVGFHPTRKWHYIGCLYQGETILNPLPLPSAHWITLQWDSLHVYLNIIRLVNN